MKRFDIVKLIPMFENPTEFTVVSITPMNNGDHASLCPIDGGMIVSALVTNLEVVREAS